LIVKEGERRGCLIHQLEMATRPRNKGR